MPSLFQAYSKLLPAYSKLFQLIPAYAQPIPSLFQAYSKLLPSLFRAIPCVFQAIPNVFQAIPALLQASPSISMTFAQEIFGSHFSVIFSLKKLRISAFLRLSCGGVLWSPKYVNLSHFWRSDAPLGPIPRVVPKMFKFIKFLVRN